MAPHPSSNDLHEWLNVAREAALRAGDCLTGGWKHIKEVTHKGTTDLVTEVDVKSQQVITETILDSFPDHSILSEEVGGHIEGSSDARWIVDPLDGTTNFVHGFPLVCVSIALEVAGELVLGVVHNPFMNELFSACKGEGAFCNGQPIRVSTVGVLQDSLISTGFPYNVEPQLDQIITRFTRVLTATQGMRRPGSAALDLCYVAYGAFEAFFEQGLKVWDMAAGVVLVREAGGMVTDLDGGAFDLPRGRILATNGRIHNDMAGLLTL